MSFFVLSGTKLARALRECARENGDESLLTILERRKRNIRVLDWDEHAAVRDGFRRHAICLERQGVGKAARKQVEKMGECIDFFHHFVWKSS